MQLNQLRLCLESLEAARDLLQRWQLRDLERGWSNLVQISSVIGRDSLWPLCRSLSRFLPRSADPDMALNSLERFLANATGAEQLPALLENRSRGLETLVQLFSSSQFFSDLLVGNPRLTEMLRVPLGRSPSRQEMERELQSEVDRAFENSAVLAAFRRFRQRHILRVGTNDIIRERPLEEVTRDISAVADAAVEVALAAALRNIGLRFGSPYTTAGTPARCVVLAFGKLGGEELNYSSDIDLMFIFDEEGTTRSQRMTTGISNGEFFGRVLSEVVHLLSAHTELGQAYRVDLRLRPEGHRGPLARTLESTLSYYDTLGRTWERQALIKLRAVAGDSQLGETFLNAIEPFIYRKYLSFSEINEIKALKRRIEHKNRSTSGAEIDVKNGYGGIRDIEFTIQFLQLLNGGDLPAVRQRNTLLALDALEHAKCLSDQEYQILHEAYRFLRKTEHRLQLMFDLQTHSLPSGRDELAKLALRMGYGDKPQGRGRGSGVRTPTLTQPTPDNDSENTPADPLSLFVRDYDEKTSLDRKILNHLLHESFQTDDGQAEPESDLILDTMPDRETIALVLGKYPFRDVQAAYQHLVQLAEEEVPFLSTRRCRHFLASIAPRLLRAIAETPDPDLALVTLEKVTASLGAKSILWELFSFNPPSLKLYVDLCAGSQFLSDILIRNPGMIDELLDSLVLNQPRSKDELARELAELCRGAADPDPILHSFQSNEFLRIGVRDILGKDTIREATAALTDLAEVLLVQIARLQGPALAGRFGIPFLAGGPHSGLPARYVLLALGKLGGREMSYHSDLDLVLVYEGDGHTGTPPASALTNSIEHTDNFHYFTELGQRIIRATSHMGPAGRLYEIDMRLRPTGKSGSLVIPLSQFALYYDEGHAQFWERMALTRARVVYGDPAFARDVMAAVERAAYGPPWKSEYVDEVAEMRERLEASRGERHLKRGFGGIVDVEFSVQLLQLKYGLANPVLRSANVWAALDAIHGAALLPETDLEILQEGYNFLRFIEGRLRIVHNFSVDELPTREDELERLARRLGFESSAESRASSKLLAQFEQQTTRIRTVFQNLLARERRS